jgi:hypothetical protein
VPPPFMGLHDVVGGGPRCGTYTKLVGGAGTCSPMEGRKGGGVTNVGLSGGGG